MTGADGFVGRHLVAALQEAGSEVIAGCRPGGEPTERWLGKAERSSVRVVPFELDDDESVGAALASLPDAVVHLAAVASGREARRDPGAAWTVNAAGTARVVEAAARLRAEGRADPLLLVISSGEVYGAGPPRPRVETDPLLPQSPYAASKVGAELAALEAWRRTGVRVIVARAFPHTGRGQSPVYALPAFVERLRAARAAGSARVSTGNLDPVRDLLDVRDVVAAYQALLGAGVPGETYNVARGEGASMRELFGRLAELIGVRAEPRTDPSLVRQADIAHLVGDPAKLRRATGWAPSITLDETLLGLVDAEAD